MIIDERKSRGEYVLSVARAMMAAARTAPKGKGIDNLELLTVAGDDLRRLGERMHHYAEELGYMFFHRDAENILASEAVVLVGTRAAAIGMNCGMCGYPTCEQRNIHPETPCGFNLTDLGIAAGSACSVAADRRLDSRVMFSAGLVAQKIGLMEGCHATLAIPLSCTGKNPYFDRVSTRPAEETEETEPIK